MVCRLLAAAVLATSTASLVSAADPCWPQWRGPNRDGKAVGEDIRTDWDKNPPKLLWSMEGLGNGYASMAIAGDRLYTTGEVGDDEVVTAVNLSTKKVQWQTPVSKRADQRNADWAGSRSTPTLDGDRVYVVMAEGGVACLDLGTGKVKWKKMFGSDYGSGNQAWGYAESPLIDGDRVIVSPGSDQALMVALDKMTGKEIWKTPYKGEAVRDKSKKEAGYSSAVISNGGGVKQYVRLAGTGAVGIRAKDGKLLWSYEKIANPTAVIPTPLVEGDYVFVSTGYGAGGTALLKLAKEGDGVRADEVYYYDAKELQNHHGQMILHEGHVYLGHKHGQGFPTCVELETGKIVWGGSENRGPDSGSAAVIFVDGHLIFRYQQRGVVALIEATPKAYNLVGTFTPEYTEGNNWAHPVVCDGELYLRQKGHLMCYDVSAK